MPCYSIEGVIPVIDPSAYVHPTAVLIGDVIVGPGCYIGAAATLRGDFGRLVMHKGSNLQDSCVVHGFPDTDTVMEEDAHIGHGAIIHGATIGRNCLVGMNAVVMDHVTLGDECIVGALTFIREGMQVPPRSIIVGNPGRIVKEVTDEMISWKTEGTRLYQQLPRDCRDSLKPCKPRRKQPSKQKAQDISYRSWTTEKRNRENS